VAGPRLVRARRQRVAALVGDVGGGGQGVDAHPAGPLPTVDGRGSPCWSSADQRHRVALGVGGVNVAGVRVERQPNAHVPTGMVLVTVLVLALITEKPWCYPGPVA